MSDPTVFSQDNDTEENKPGVPEENKPEAFADQLAQILNEDGKPKYKDVETALNALKASQEFIPSLKQEKDSLTQQVDKLKEELTKRSAFQDVVDQLKQPPQEQVTEEQMEQQSLTPEQVQSMLEQYVPQYLDQRQEQTTAQTNIRAVDSKLKEFYGDKVEEAVKAKSEGLGLSIQDLEALSAKSPTSVLELLGVKDVKPTDKTISSSVNLPPINKPSDDLRPSKSMLLGATGKEQAEYMRMLKDNVMRKHGYTS